MHPTNSVPAASSVSQRTLILFALGSFALLVFWILMLSSTMSSIVAEAVDDDAAEAIAKRQPSHRQMKSKEQQQQKQQQIQDAVAQKPDQVAPTTDNDGQVQQSSDETPAETVQRLRAKIRALEVALSSAESKSGGGGSSTEQLRQELFRAIDQQSALRHELNECKKKQQLLLLNSAGKSKKPESEDARAKNPSEIVGFNKPRLDQQTEGLPHPQQPNQQQRQQQHPQQQSVPQESQPLQQQQRHFINNNFATKSSSNKFPAEASGGHVVKASENDDPKNDPPGTIPILVLSYNRAARVQRLLQRLHDLIRKHSSSNSKVAFRVIVSQDMDSLHPEVTTAIRDAQQRTLPSLGIVYLAHNRDDSGATREEIENGWEAYYAISKHYAWALATTFELNKNYQRVIILEEDLELADDFLEYMTAMSPLFDKEEQQGGGSGGLYCVSAFNDNGKALSVCDPTAAYRSDFFPGLGWMTSRKIWEELRVKWPRGFWDDWMRQPAQRKGRSCIRPEVARSRALCEDGEGTSQGQFCEHLSQIVLYGEGSASAVRTPPLSSSSFSWSQVDIDSLLPQRYDKQLAKWLADAKMVYNIAAIDRLPPGTKEVKMLYPSNEVFEILAQTFNLMSDFKDGVPRTAYHGVVSFRWHGSGVRAPFPPRLLPDPDGGTSVIRVHLYSDHVLYENKP